MSLNIIPTKAALAKQKTLDFKAIVFEEPKFIKNERPAKEKREKRYSDDDFDDFNDFDDDEDRPKPKKKKDDSEFDIKRARHEVIRFANEGIKKIKNKRKAEMNLIVKLGGKPKKRHYKNYKELVEERKRNQKIREERQKFKQLGKNMNGNCTVKCNKRQKKSKVIVDGISKNYGVVKPKLKKGK